MENEKETFEKVYSTSEVATMLDIAVPTVRKYAQYLERAGYIFLKNEGKARLFVEGDIMALRYLVELRKRTNITVEQATDIVIERFGKGAIQGVRGNDIAESNRFKSPYDELKEMIHKQSELLEAQTELIKQLTQRLDQQQQYIDKRLNERDQLLLQTIRETQEETRKQIATAQEKQPFWKRLFK